MSAIHFAVVCADHLACRPTCLCRFSKIEQRGALQTAVAAAPPAASTCEFSTSLISHGARDTEDVAVAIEILSDYLLAICLNWCRVLNTGALSLYVPVAGRRAPAKVNIMQLYSIFQRLFVRLY